MEAYGWSGRRGRYGCGGRVNDSVMVEDRGLWTIFLPERGVARVEFRTNPAQERRRQQNTAPYFCGWRLNNRRKLSVGAGPKSPKVEQIAGDVGESLRW